MRVFNFRSWRLALSNATAAVILILAASTFLAGCQEDSVSSAGARGAEGAGGAGPWQYAFVRAPRVVLRLDTSNGQVWVVPQNGDGGWLPLLEPAPDAGKAATFGRYRLNNVGQKRGGGDPNDPDLMRLDQATGRAWLGFSKRGGAWITIAEPGGSTGGAAAPQLATPARAPAPLAISPEDIVAPVPKGKANVSPEEAAEHVAGFAEALQKEALPQQMRVWAARQLGRYDRDLAAPRLIEALDDDNAEVVVAVIESLVQLDDRASIPDIVRLKDHSDPKVRAAATTALEAR